MTKECEMYATGQAISVHINPKAKAQLNKIYRSTEETRDIENISPCMKVLCPIAENGCPYLGMEGPRVNPRINGVVNPFGNNLAICMGDGRVQETGRFPKLLEAIERDERKHRSF